MILPCEYPALSPVSEYTSSRFQDFRFSENFKHHPTTGVREDGMVRGLVAQEVEEVLPSAVYTQKQGEEMADGSVLEQLKVVDMQPVTVEMVGAVRALAKRVMELQSRAKHLRAEVEIRRSSLSQATVQQ